jgi:archaemetzincin
MGKSWLPERIAYEAIGLKDCDKKTKLLIKPTDSFPLIPYPVKDEWLIRTNEAPQSYQNFVKSKKMFNEHTSKIIYLVKIGHFDNISIEILAEYVYIFFGLPVKILNPIILTQDKLDECNVRTQYKVDQLLTDAVYENILKPIMPNDAMYVIGITNYDLYSESSSNYVFGQADIDLQCGIFSFYRYLYNDDANIVNEKLLLRRTCKLMVHEIFHLFGVNHCQYFQCVMMGANSLNESDKQPLELCPVCLHKLTYVVPTYEIINRYEALQTFYLKYPDEFSVDILWLNQRLMEINL